MPRETNLTPSVQKKILSALKTGAYFSTACILAGISEKTGSEWLQRGEGASDRDDREPYAVFAVEVRRVQAETESKAIARIQRSAIGRKHQRVKIVEEKVKGEDGEESDTVVIKTETTTEEKYDWAADKWYLSVTSPQRWGEHRMMELEALKVLVDADWLPPEILEMATREIISLKQSLRDTIGELIAAKTSN